MKKIVNILSIIFMITIILFTNQLNLYAEKPADFKHIGTASNWAKKEIKDCYADIEGFYYMPKIFDANFKGAATREQFTQLATIYYEILASQNFIELPTESKNIFTDCNKPYINNAYNYGIIKGVSANKFDPYGSLTREQMCTILYRLLGKFRSEKEMEISNISFLKNYNDIDKISPWALDAVKFMNHNKIMLGDGFSLNPRQKVTREQAIALMYRTYNSTKQLNQLKNTCHINAHNYYIHGMEEYPEETFEEYVLFENYDDFDNDGMLEGVLVIRSAPEQNAKEIAYINFDKNGTINQDAKTIDCSENFIHSAKIIKLNSFDGKKLLVQTQPSHNSNGFIVYSLSENILIPDVFQAKFDSGVGNSSMYDENNDGIYEGFTEEKWSYDVFYYPVTLNMYFDNASISFKNGSIDTGEYPSTPEEVVKQYLNLVCLKENMFYGAAPNSYLNIAGLDKRINELYKGGFDSKYVYDQNILKNTNIGIEPNLGIKTTVNLNTATVKTNNSQKYTYNLKRLNNRWVIERISK